MLGPNAPRSSTILSPAGKFASCSQSSFLGDLGCHTALQEDEAPAVDVEQLRQQLAEARAQAQTATEEAATLQRQLDSARTATAARKRQLVEEREAARAAAATDAMRCAAAKAALQRAEAAAKDARTELAAVKAEVRPTAGRGLCVDTCLSFRWQGQSAESARETSAALCCHCHGRLCWNVYSITPCVCASSPACTHHHSDAVMPSCRWRGWR